MKKVLLALFLVMNSIAVLADDVQNCVIISSLKPELATKTNKTTLCRDAQLTLSEQKGYNSLNLLKLTVTSTSMYSVSMKYEFLDVNGDLIEGRGIEFWYPGDNFFQIN